MIKTENKILVFCLCLFVSMGLFCCKKKKENDGGIAGDIIRTAQSTQTKLTKTNMNALKMVILASFSETGRLPDDLNELRSSNPTVTETYDTWGNRIRYEKKSESSFWLISAGMDRAFDTDDDIVIKQ
jgi:hypothetical protein